MQFFNLSGLLEEFGQLMRICIFYEKATHDSSYYFYGYCYPALNA